MPRGHRVPTGVQVRQGEILTEILVGGAAMLRRLWRLAYNVAAARSDSLYSQGRFGDSERWGALADLAAVRCW